jgi:hypothetical protein
MTTPMPDTKPVARSRRLFVAAAATLGATVWAALQGDDAPADPALPPRPATSAPRATHSGRTALEGPASWPAPPGADARPAWPEPPATALAAWGPPPPPPPPPSPPPPPPAPPRPVQAPPFPYTVIGRVDDGTPRVMFSGPQRSFGAKARDVIDGSWRIDAIEARGITLTWLPADIHRTLAFPSS